MFKKKVETKVNELALARTAFFSARDELALAEINFNNADPAFFEVANLELSLAKMKLSVCEKKVRLLTNL